MEDLTPRRIVDELDRYIVGQRDAKRAVAIALRNRWRRARLEPEIRDEVIPKNILMIGPTGVGKTEIARRLALLVKAPFLKVEASKYTEVGYVGRDVESMIRDLAAVSVSMVRAEQAERVRPKARERAEERILDLLLPARPPGPPRPGAPEEPEAPQRASRERLREKLRAGELEERPVEIQVREKPPVAVGVLSAGGNEQMGMDLQEMMQSFLPAKSKRKRATVREARETITQEEEESLFDRDAIHREAIGRVESSGIVFIDEVDKIASRAGEGAHGPDVSREGVQRDLLPIVEGTSVPTRYGVVRTDHILFIAAGAFHTVSPSDLIPEFVGRFPIRVELESLTEADFARILVEPRNALTRQYQALLATEGVEITFREDSIQEIARLAFRANAATQNIGARRLYTLLEKLLEDVSFDAPDLAGRAAIPIDAAYVRDRVEKFVESEDLTRYIL